MNTIWQHALDYTVRINGREYWVYIEQAWREGSPSNMYRTSIDEGGAQITSIESKGLSLTGHAETAFARILDYEEAHHEPAV